MADPIQVKYAGYTHNFPPDATQDEISAALGQWESTPRTPTGVANRELNRIHPGLQVSGKEMNPRAIANATPIEYAGGGGGKLDGAAEGVLSTIPKIGESIIAPRQGDYGDDLANMAKSIIGLPKSAGEHIAGAINAWRGNEPYTAGQEGAEGAIDTASALGMGKSLGGSAPSLIRGGARTGNAILKPLGSKMVQEVAPAVGSMAGFHGYLMGKGIRALGKGIENGFRIPGENFGLDAPRPLFAGGAMEPAAGPEKAASVGIGRPSVGPATLPPLGVPPRGGPIPESVATPEAPAIARPGVSIPDQIATARGLGFKNLGEAISKFGQEGWERVLSDAPPNPSPTASVGPIGRPSPFSTEGRQPIQSPSSIQRFRDIKDDAGVKQELEGEQGPASMVTGRKGGGASLFPRESQSLLGEERLTNLEKGRKSAARNSMDQTKGAVMANFKGVAAPRLASDVQAARPLPGADVAANRLIGHPTSPKTRRP